MTTMNTNRTIKPLLLATTLALALGQNARAGSLTLPHEFQADTKAVAAEVNANFDAVKTAVDDNDSRIDQLLQRITDLENELADLKNNSVLALDGKLELVDPDDHGYATARFTGVNVQVVNGIDQSTANGLGNLIIGYNADRAFLFSGVGEVCSDGEYDNQSECESNGATWAVSHKSGSHNLVGGNKNSYSATGGLVFGWNNVINRNYASVSGGYNNKASGQYSSINGGFENTASGLYSSVSGGRKNIASEKYSSVNGGYNNKASNFYSSISGGFENTASGQYSSVSGGYNNTASGSWSSVLGGSGNTASGNYSIAP
jgi:hypothetical protein